MGRATYCYQAGQLNRIMNMALGIVSLIVQGIELNAGCIVQS